MNKKTPLPDYFETYRPFSRDGIHWYVLSNLDFDPHVVSIHSDEVSARDHARRLNALWRERFYGNHPAYLPAPSQPRRMSDSAFLARKLKSLLAGTLLFLRSRFQSR